MKLLRHVSSASLLSLTLGLVGHAVALSPAHAEASLSPAAQQYADMCANQATGIPAPYGEADLKGNTKLHEYCGCFGTKFAERALASVKSGAKSSSLEDTVKEEQAMRNSCRQQLGLPLLKAEP